MINKNKRKSKDIGLINDSSLVIDGDIMLSSVDEHKASSYLPIQIILSFFATFCTAGLAESFIDSGANIIILFFYSILVSVSFGMIKSKYNIIRNCSIAISFLEIVYLFMISDKIKMGLYVVVDDYLRKANQPNSFLGIKLNGLRLDEYSYYASFFFIALIAIVGIAVVCACVYKIDFPLLFIFTFPIFELGMYWGWEANSFFVLGLLLCWILILSMHIINHTTNKAGRNNTFAVHERKKTFYFTSAKAKSAFYPEFVKFVASLTATVFIVIVILSAVTGFVRPESFTKYRKDISTAVSNFTLSDIENAFSDYDGGLDLFGVKTVGGTNGGILGTTEGISFNGSIALKLTTQSFNVPMYLKGYVAGEYEDNKWTAVTTNESENDFLNLFDDSGYWPQDLNYLYLCNKGIDKFDKNVQDITINVKGASKKFVYAPYGTLYSSTSNSDNEQMKPIYESYVKLAKTKYTLKYYNANIFDSNSWEEISSQINTIDNVYFDGTQSKAVEDYERYISSTYKKEITSNAIDMAYNIILDNYLDGNKSAPYEDVYDAIKMYLSDNYSYTLEPGITPDGEDFIDYFLTTQKKGYCSYFATTGVALLRKFGYASRYVEGYIVLPSQLNGNKLENSSEYEIDVKDKCAHAWAEVYIENAGWFPAEFTPGYENNNPNLTETEKDPSKTETVTVTTKGTNTATENSTTDSNGAQTSMTTSATATTKINGNSGKSTEATTKQNGEGGTGKTTVKKSDANSVSTVDTKSMSQGTKAFLYLLFGFILVILSVLINRNYRFKQMKEKCTQKNKNECVKEIFRYTVKYLSLIDINTNKNLTDLQTCHVLIEKCHEKKIYNLDDSLEFICDIAVKAHMSDATITKDEADRSYKIMREISDKVVRPKLSTYKLFIARIVYCLY